MRLSASDENGNVGRIEVCTGSGKLPVLATHLSAREGSRVGGRRNVHFHHPRRVCPGDAFLPAKVPGTETIGGAGADYPCPRYIAQPIPNSANINDTNVYTP